MQEFLLKFRDVRSLDQLFLITALLNDLRSIRDHPHAEPADRSHDFVLLLMKSLNITRARQETPSGKGKEHLCFLCTVPIVRSASRIRQLNPNPLTSSQSDPACQAVLVNGDQNEEHSTQAIDSNGNLNRRPSILHMGAAVETCRPRPRACKSQIFADRSARHEGMADLSFFR